nr:MAG TPA: endopeptidase tail [Caudoviricetes sp.]
MIVIYADGKKIYDPRIEKLQLEEAELSQAKNKAGSMTFTIPTAHTYAQTSIIPGITRIVVKEDEETVFKGRITKTNPNFYDDSECTAEGDLAYLNDTVVRPYEYAGSPREYFAFLIEQHNAQVEKERQFAVGRVTVADPNDYIVRSSAQYPSTWEELETKLLDSMGGFLVERWEDGVTYLDYLAEIRENNEQVAKYGENIVDIDRIKEIDSGFATAVIPLGKKQEAEDGKEAQYLTIKSINNGKDYVQNDDAVSKYGLILKTVEHEDVTLPENLLRKGKEDLTEAIKSVESITVTAADLSGTGVKVESFRFMKNVRCVSKHHGLDFRSPVVSLARNLLDRSDYKITVGDTQKSYTGASITSKRETESKAEEIISLEREARKKAIEDLVSKVEKAPGLYITDTGEGEAHNWYLHDKKTVEESYIIIRVNAAGIIFSTDGGNHYNGVSWDGDAILKKIYAIGIDANHINAGELNAAIVKIKNLHLQDISDDKGVTLDATLNGITADVSSKYTELDGKISENSASISMLPDSITSTVKKSYIDPLTGRVSNAESDIDAAEKRITQNEKDILSAQSSITQTASSITADVSAKYKELDGKISDNSASISLLPNSITSTVKTTYIDPLTTRMESAEASIKINEQGIESKVSKNSVISSINQSSESVTISASKINLKGAVTISSLDSDLKTSVNTASSTLSSWSYDNNMTTIDGGKVAAHTITAEQIAIGDFTNYATVTENDAATLLSDQAISSSSTHGDWIEKKDKQTGLKHLFVSQLYCINSFVKDDVLKFDFNVWCEAAQTVTYGIWLYDGSKTFKTGAWNTAEVPEKGAFRNFTGTVKVPTLPINTKYYRVGFEFKKYDSTSRNCVQKVKVTKISGYLQIGEGYIDSAGPFKIGCMQSVGELNDDVEFKHAIFVDYGIELLAGNDGSTPYIDFHTEATSHDNAAYDYTARLQNTQKSWITFYGLSDGKNPPAGCTVQSAQFRGTLVNDSDRRLKQDIVDLSIDEVLKEISKYRPVSYKYINGVDDNVHHGLIAQEAQEIAQWGLVDDRGEYLAINYIDLISDLIKTTQYSLKEIEKLKTIIDN